MCKQTIIISFFLFQVIYYKVGKWYERHAHEGLFPVEGDGRSRRRFKRVFSTARNMVMVILFCWTPGTHSRTCTFKANIIHVISTSDWCLVHLPAAALALILLSTLMIWTNVEQRSLFWLYVIQVSFRRPRPNQKRKFGVWVARFTIVCVYFRLRLCPCKASWTVWFTPGDGPTSRRPFLGRIHPW